MQRAAFSLLLLFCFFGAVSLVHAQALPGGTDPLSVTLDPQFPRPYDVVTVSIDSQLIDLASSVISMTVDGKAVSVDGRTADVQLKGSGTKTKIVVKVKAPDGISYQQTLSVMPADVVLISEPVSTTPLFYPGAALVAPEGRVRLIAVPDFRTTSGARIPASSLVYSWKLNQQVLNDQSGIGKSILSATAPVRYRDATVTVTVSVPNGSLVGQAAVLVSPVAPFVRIYKNDPLKGIDFAHALSGDFFMKVAEETVRAAPFYFTTQPLFSWSVGESGSGTEKDLTLRSTGSSAGTAPLSLSVTQGTQSADAGLTVHFGESSTGTFGL